MIIVNNKKIKLTIFLLFVLFHCFTQKIQEKITIKDIVYFNYIPDYFDMIRFKNKNVFNYINHDTLFEYDIKTLNDKYVLSITELNHLIQSKNKAALFPDYFWKEKELCLYNNNWFCKINSVNKEIIYQFEFPKGADSLELSPSKNHIAFVEGKDIFISDLEGKTINITREEQKSVFNGQIASRQEFGITKGLFWSPDGNKIAYYKIDMSGVCNYPLIDFSQPYSKLKYIKYPFAGTSNEIVSVYIYNLITKMTTRLKTGNVDQFLTSVTWDTKGESIYIAHVNREQSNSKFIKYNSNTGEKLDIVFEENNIKYVEPEFPAYFINDNEFLWLSRRDGYSHFYLYNSKGKLIQQLTRGKWEVTEFLGYDSTRKYLFYVSTQASVLQRHLYRLNMQNGEIRRITKYDGINICTLSRDYEYCVNQFQNSEIPNKISLLYSDGKMITSIYNQHCIIDVSKVCKKEISKIKAADDSTDLYYRMIKPYNFDSTNKYPVIVYVYGGPHIQLVTNQWPDRNELLLMYLSQLGFVTFTLDGRGSAFRGTEFEKCTFRQLGQEEMKDQMKGIEYLKTKKWVDTNRIGIHGWSFGGFMTLSLLTNYPEVFKVGVAGGPVTDWSKYEIMYTERYMDKPEENEQGYYITNVNHRAYQLNAHLLIVQGAMDQVVVWQNSMSFINECIKFNKPVDYFIYPNYEHHVIGKDRIHLLNMISNYFEKNL